MIFIYIVLASQFGSFLQPIAIMASLPLSLIGVMLALLAGAHAQRVLDDRPDHADGPGHQERHPCWWTSPTRARRGARASRGAAAGRQIRMRPIIMTTAAMVFGMLPLALALNDGGDCRRRWAAPSSAA